MTDIKKKTILKFIIGIILCIATLFISYQSFYRVVYPLEYTQTIATASADTGIDEALILAVIRTESGFDPTAISHVGAMGLMQITPDTLHWVQLRTGEAQTAPEDVLYDPHQNIHYGAHILMLLTQEFVTEREVLAAYHAGWGNVTSWLADSSYSSDGKTLDTIPFADTAYYVDKVLETKEIYRNIYPTIK